MEPLKLMSGRLFATLGLILLGLSSAHAATLPNWFTQGPTPVSDGTERMQWKTDAEDAVVIWSLDANGNYVSSSPVYGPYANWLPLSIVADRNDTKLSLLWRGVDGNGGANNELLIWRLDSGGNYVSSSQIFLPTADWTASELLPNNDGTFRLIWYGNSQKSQNSQLLWNLDANYKFVSSSNVLMPGAGWSSNGYVQGYDSSLYADWINYGGPDNALVFWKLDATGNYVSSSPQFGPIAGWDTFTPYPKHDGTFRLFWENIDNKTNQYLGYEFWNLDANGNYVSSSNVLTPGAGWTNPPTLLPNFTDDTLQLLWSNYSTPTGAYQFWNLDTNGNYVSSSPVYGPFTGWEEVGSGIITPLAGRTKQLFWGGTTSAGYSNGEYVIWNLDANGNYVSSSQVYGPYY